MLIYLDSYKLVSFRSVLTVIGAGAAVAGVLAVVNSAFIGTVGLDGNLVRGFVAPVIEEACKAAFVIFVIWSKRVGFMVDAAIYGFGIGAGFALAENIYYLNVIGTSSALTWILRGFGTAIMHGGTTALVAIISKGLYDRHDHHRATFLPGVGLAIAIHILHNQFIVSPVVTALVMHVSLPLLLVFTFYHSERSTRRWLGNQFDTDTELLDMINSGRVGDTRLGHYFKGAQAMFPPEILVDMLCYIRLNVELAISAKGILLMREAGFSPKPEALTREKFAELRELEGSIGRTGLRALRPFLNTKSRDLWQLHMLDRAK